ncbi:uncharacterized protein LOC124125703 isoform X4 [Haliotis rufescens]|uniref:uncharacterized protein LOC124125703 isoform X4 n=1 Tax=Haliotis rufescens TaxID=6454 RepID=UPI00201F0B58|nr:uncharacterized protein LOC124125703 isoform X4 [Haliotis rufescens]
MNRNVISFLCVLQYVTMAVWAGVLYFASLSYVAGDCTPGKYGYRCSYQCYCPLVNCNSTSGCEPANCSDGWSGPTCQKENLAFNMTTSSSSVHFPSSNAVNGDIKGGDEHRCFHSVYDDANITSAWWRVDLGNETLVRDVVIYFRTNYIVRRNGIQIYIADTDNSSTDGVNCYNVTGNRNGTDIPDVLNVTCSDEGRFLVLYTTTVNNEINNVNVPVLDFCEVKVEVCGPGTFGADCNNYCHCDGEVCNYLSGVCPSGDCLPGWQPDKCDTVCVFGGYGRNCNGRCPDRHCKGDNSSCAHVTGKCVEGCEAGWNGTDCTQKCVNSYGEGCVHLCSSRRCSGTSSCNHVTGHCENGCRHGWKHIDCTEACIQGVEHGAGCVSNCSARMCKGGNFTCPRDTGQCVSGCHSGWKGGDCATACVQGMEYGAGCVGHCSARMCKGGNDTCPRDTGQCVSGCQPGWKGEDCATACVQGVEYGAVCEGNCSARMCKGGNDTCPRDTGQCVSGCQPGWKREDCTQTCVQGMEYGAGCVGNCSARMCKGGNVTCPWDTGRCVSGCQPGWKGEDCATACVQGVEYGAVCEGNCSARMCKGGNDTCPRDTGQCVSGCQPGWKREDCTQTTACVQGLEYGANCVGNCSARMCGGEIATCPWDTGRCESGCQSGWKGGDCITAISMPVPSNAGAIAGAILAVLAVLAIIVVVVVVFRRRKSHPKRSDDHTDMFEIHKGHISDKGLENSAHKGVVEEDEDGVEEDQNMEDHSATYYNIASAPAVTVVSVDQLGERIKELQVPVGRFQAEFQKLSTTFTRPYKNSQLEENKGKNKYISYYPYDATRVVLKEVPDQPGSDYINASYIDGHSQPKAYIAAQAPNKKTLTDFWKMIWEQNCTQIVMLTNLKELGRVKCEAYWSDTSDMRVGDFIISVTDSKRRANWVVRELQVTETKTNTSRCFDHFHFTTWPDHGTPEETALTEFLWLVRTAPTIQHEALLVHCSAGVGRTGTYIAVDYLLDQALAEDRVDVFGCVSRMRDQRKGMIQTKEQYTCVYMALYETLEFGNTAISVEDFRYRRNMRGAFSMGRMAVSKLIETLNTERKEQSQEPSVRGRVWINGCSDILAVSSRSHLSVKGYLLTEAPSVTTASLFWKLTEEQESSTVIVLPDSHQSLSSFVPSTGDSLDLGPVNVRCSRETTVNTDITLLNIHRQMENSPTALVHVYVLNILPAESPSTLLELLEQVDRHTGEVNPHTVTVIYSDGGRQNGAMLCILSNIVQGLKHDKRAEIYNNMRTMTHCLDQDITQDDIALCYDVATAYLESQNIYANM